MNTIYATLALRYTQAFMNVFSSSIELADISNLEKCAQFFDSKKDLVFFFNIPLVPVADKKRILDKICKDHNLSSMYHRLGTLLIAHQRALLIPMVFIMIKNHYKKLHKISAFVVTSSHELNQSEQCDIEQFLLKKLDGSVSCSYKIDKTLIAGVRMTSGTLLWEHSIQKRLIKFKNALRR